jgi:predicted nuclease of restriction endonuclease-like (RecB) superfamily
MPNEILPIDLYEQIRAILQEARARAYRAVNTAMVEAYWNVGRLIVEEEQKGQKRANYGSFIIQSLAQRLTVEFGSGFDPSNLKRMRQFYLGFPKGAATWHHLEEAGKSATPWHLLSWSHYKLLIRVEKEKARLYYAQEAADQNWSTRALERQINSLYYERLLSSQTKAPVEAEAEQTTKQLAAQPEDFIKDPYVLEFLKLPSDHTYLESQLEQALLGNLQKFLLELGKGFSFVDRQKRISTETKEFYIDLVFYNYLLKCFVLIDLKTGELTHQDIGQMDMYVRLFEDRYKPADDNPTIGIILCTEKDATIVRYSVMNENKKLFASKYRLVLPTEEELQKELEREKRLLLKERKEE